jgi:hypothetical protein
MSEIFNTIKTSILGTKTSDIDREIDGSFRSIERYSISSDRNKYIEAIKDLIAKTGTAPDNSLIKGLQGNPQVQTYDQTGRISRYNEYDAITRKISYCQRALDTLVDHIISPDDITKTSLQFVTDNTADESSDLKTTLARCKKIQTKLELEKKIRKIVRVTLHKGDNFVEIIHSPQGQQALSILHEGKECEVENKIFNFGDSIQSNLTYEVPNKDDNNKKDEVTRTNKIVLEATYFTGLLSGMPGYTAGANVKGDRAVTSMPYVPNPKSKDAHSSGIPDTDEDKKFKAKFDDPGKTVSKEDELKQLRDLFITVHNPKYIIRLETERFKTCLGYLVFPKIDPALASIGSSLMSVGLNSVDSLCQQIVGQIQNQLKASNDKIKVSPELKQALLTYLTSIQNNDDLKIRYVAPELMIHWRINSELFDPYGESIFECVNFDCRLLIALKTATTIKRLTYATDKRVISVETGLPRDAKNIIETIKEGLNKKKISVDSMGSIDNIPSQIPTFETIYIPMRDGKKFVEFDKMEWGMNPQEDIEPLKFIRDNIVANLGVPAPYLGLEENMSNRSLLTVENINFTRTIIAYQKELSQPLKEMFEKIYKLVFPDYENLEKIQITYQEPKISPYEHQMEYVEQMQRLIEALRSLGVPVEWLKKKYLPNIDWEEIEKFNAEEIVKKELGDVPSDQETMGGGTMLGGIGGGMV